jgi:hypothetical protein
MFYGNEYALPHTCDDKQSFKIGYSNVVKKWYSPWT